MNSVNSQVNIVKQRATFEKVCDFKIQNGYLLCPREDISNGNMYCICTSGDLFTFNEGSSELVASFNGEPYSICFDSSGTFYMSDLLTNCVFYKQGCKIFV